MKLVNSTSLYGQWEEDLMDSFWTISSSYLLILSLSLNILELSQLSSDTKLLDLISLHIKS